MTRLLRHKFPLNVGDSAHIQQHDKTWKPAVVTARHNSRSYTVRTTDGSVYTRNRQHLLKSKQQTADIDVPDYEIQSAPENLEPHGEAQISEQAPPRISAKPTVDNQEHKSDMY